MNNDQDPLDRLLRCAAQARRVQLEPSASMEQRVLGALRARRPANLWQELIPVLRIGLGFAIACFLVAAVWGTRQLGETQSAEDNGITVATTTIAWAR